jgi:hypothetical protein
LSIATDTAILNCSAFETSVHALAVQPPDAQRPAYALVHHNSRLFLRRLEARSISEAAISVWIRPVVHEPQVCESRDSSHNYAVRFDVTDSGARPGADVAQVYVSEEHPSVARPPQELKGFARVALDPGQTRHGAVALDSRAFTWYDEKAAALHADAGAYAIHVSRSSADAQLEGKSTLDQVIVLPVK